MPLKIKLQIHVLLVRNSLIDVVIIPTSTRLLLKLKYWRHSGGYLSYFCKPASPQLRSEKISQSKNCLLLSKSYQELPEEQRLQSSTPQQHHKADWQPLPTLCYGPYTCATDNANLKHLAAIKVEAQLTTQ